MSIRFVFFPDGIGSGVDLEAGGAEGIATFFGGVIFTLPPDTLTL